ncbi:MULTISPECIES: CBS domain-containing protein [unclassified Robiginitalea]|uniref:CBS domain-containing protein n=1 Tax=Robiginitalea TaxID=252306 RepID=UPI0023497CF2|nr:MULTISPECIES: CBS domain-containing protein [unclassified Robiginitalea]MDC6353145.1 CBS domain-containing protein [Robiginitalea sp. PM2]MDC6373688.1 CBS domain-containing protein [Robiginitalea sp. SP8]
MGNLAVKTLDTSLERAQYYRQLLTDIAALEVMLEDGFFERNEMHIGAEQEFCLVNADWEPSMNAPKILSDLNEPHFTPELTRYNLEINLDPRRLQGTCLSDMHNQLRDLLGRAQEAAARHGDKIILTGVLPTISTRHLSQAYMAPLNRYRILNEAVKHVRDSDLEMHIKGVDEVNLHHDSIMYEGCNTSFQSHLQIDPEDFSSAYNWAQAIAGPVLSVCANSPLLMGRELWEETRIALFSQSVDTRRSTFRLNEREPRVGFGSEWETGSAADFFKRSVARYRSLISTDFEASDSLEQVNRGQAPALTALSLYNGTVYPWNRLCYGRGGKKPHLRIENRYLPSGPTTADEIANLAFWTGIMTGRPSEFDDIRKKMDFRDAKKNFFHAARYGMSAQFRWQGKDVPARELLLDFFLPIAYRGLSRMQVAGADITKYLKLIENRIRSQSGAEWKIRTYRELRKELRQPDALRVLTASLYNRSLKGYPVATWKKYTCNEVFSGRRSASVRDLMSTRIITAHENDSAALVVHLMKWNGFHHLPVLDGKQELIGLLSWKDVGELADSPEIYDMRIADLMKTELITTGPDKSIRSARELMASYGIHCLPVVSGRELIGLLTSTDIDNED